MQDSRNKDILTFQNSEKGNGVKLLYFYKYSEMKFNTYSGMSHLNRKYSYSFIDLSNINPEIRLGKMFPLKHKILKQDSSIMFKLNVLEYFQSFLIPR